MAEKTLNTRIQLKYDSYTNWTTNNPVLKKGELAIVNLLDSDNVAQNEPTLMMKVGDGVKAFNDLGWVTGLAGDVYSWAKAATKPTYTAGEIQGLDTQIQSVDTNTTYQIVKVGTHGIKLQSKEKGSQAWNDVGTITVDKYDDAAVKADIQKLQGLVGETAVNTQITNAIGALDVTDSAVATQLVSAVSETNGKIKVERRALVAADIPEIAQSKVAGLASSLAGKQDNLVFGTAYNSSTNKAATMADIKNATAGLSGAMHFKGVVKQLPTATDYNVGDVVVVGNKEYVLIDNEGKKWEELGNPSNYAVKGSIVDADIAANANIAQSKIVGLTEALGSKADKSALEEVKGSLSGYVTKGEATGYNDILTNTSAASTYVKQVPGKGLSTNDYDATAKGKVDALKALSKKDKVAESDFDTALGQKFTKHGTDIADLQSHALRDTDTLIFNCGDSKIA